MDYRELLRTLRLRPGMFFGLSELTYDLLVSFVTGLSFGRPHLLAGFREFLVLKLNDGNNLVWPALVTRLVVPHAVHPLGPADDRAALDGLFDLLDEFLAETTTIGSGSIEREHFLWLQRQSWYDLDLERFNSSPAPQMFGLDEAAERLGVQRSALFDLMASRKLRSFRIGAELLFAEHDITQLESQVDYTRTGLPSSRENEA